LQLDVYGEVMDALYHARSHGLALEEAGWSLQRTLVKHLETIWQEPDEGIWEIRGPRRHFTYSKVMVWVAVDRMVKSVEEFDLDGPVAHWRALRHEIHDDICENGLNAKVGSFMQYYGAEEELDASLLHIPLVGFLPIDDERVAGTIAAIERDLNNGGFVRRYDATSSVDGLSGDEGVFLSCSFWLVECMTLQGRLKEARTLFERLLELRNDVGLLSEEYDVGAQRQVGNFPQAFSHIALVNAAFTLSEALWPEQHRRVWHRRDK
jgi:GH15 family glucan-1,4-alpha-glucosidase